MPVLADNVLSLAAFGLYPVRLHYPIFRDGQSGCSCSCGKPDCKAQGKHPVGNQWGKSATQDGDIIEAQWRDERWNVGIILGLCHGIPADKAVIDIEDDSIEGRALADTILRDFPCPTYTSGKSLHRLYRWSEGLPPVANMTIKGLEFRFGGKGKETQSVAPPSIHMSGLEYRWLDGMSLADIPLTPLPDHLCQYLCEEWAKTEAGSPGTTSTTDARKFRSPQGKIGVGARHHSLLIEANHLWRYAFQLWGINGIEEQERIDQVYMWLLGANLLVCDPPKTESEVHVICRSAQVHMTQIFGQEIDAKMQASAPTAAVNSDDRSFSAWLHASGIRLVYDPQFDPSVQDPDRIDEWACDWSMKYMTKADEDLVELVIPLGEGDSVGDCEQKSILMRVAEFDSAASVARKIQQESDGRINLGRTFPAWSWRTIWDGQYNDARRRNGITRGLREFLISAGLVEQRAEGTGGLCDQVEDLIDAMSGNLSRLLTAMAVWTNRGHRFEGRMKIVPGGDELTSMRTPEDPLTGYYAMPADTETETNNTAGESEGGVKVVLLVKLDELSRRYRQSYGSVVASRQISDAVESLGFVRKKFSHGPLSGRWFMKDINK